MAPDAELLNMNAENRMDPRPGLRISNAGRCRFRYHAAGEVYLLIRRCR